MGFSGASTPLYGGDRVSTDRDEDERTSCGKGVTTDLEVAENTARHRSSGHVCGSAQRIPRVVHDGYRPLYLSREEGGGPNWRELPSGPLLRTFELLWALEWKDSCQRAASNEPLQLKDATDTERTEGEDDRRENNRRDCSLMRCTRVCRSWRACAQEILLGDTAASRPVRCGMTIQHTPVDLRVLQQAGSEYTTMAGIDTENGGNNSKMTDGEACSRPVRGPPSTSSLPPDLVHRHQQQQQLRQRNGHGRSSRINTHARPPHRMSRGGVHITQQQNRSNWVASPNALPTGSHASQAPSNEDEVTGGVMPHSNTAQVTPGKSIVFSEDGLSQDPSSHRTGSGCRGQQGVSELTSGYQHSRGTAHNCTSAEEAC